MGRGWKSFGMHGRKSLHYCDQTIKNNSGEGSEKKSRIPNIPRECLGGSEQDIHGNMNSKGHSDEVSAGNEEHVIGNWRKGHPRYKGAKNMAERSCPSIS